MHVKLVTMVRNIHYICLIMCVSSFATSVKMDFEKYKFPKDFLFGVSTSAYQIEGGHNADGKGESVWDHYTKKFPKKIIGSANGNVACDSYRKYKEDVTLLKDLGVHFYRFSISWTRILPDGYSNNINMAGLRYYNELINELLKRGIQPMVTMYHRDLPLVLQELGGWTNPYMAYYFEDYARILYSYFGDRVKYWITFNAECLGYGDDEYPPYLNRSGVADYLCTHVMLLAHAKAYQSYDQEFRKLHKGKVGIVLDGNWYDAGSFEMADIEAGERLRAFKLGAFLNPIFHADGNYPKLLRERVDNVSKQEGYLQSRLPTLSPQEVEFVQGTYDFLGLNCYTTFLARNSTKVFPKGSSVDKDMGLEVYQKEEWPETGIDWMKVHPEGLRKLLRWIKDTYDDPDIIITENGYPDDGEIEDVARIKFLQQNLQNVLEAIHEDNVSVKGYAVWSLLDNFEWNYGYSKKFGLYHVDFKDPKRKRTPKKSVEWYKKVIQEGRIIDLKELTGDVPTGKEH